MNIQLEKIAKELLVDEDCVIIPEFGGFITHYKPAQLEPNKNIILPPGKSVSFNAKLSKNDGLLAQSVAFKTGLNYNDSLKAIQLKVSFWEKELNETKYLELDGFGSFILNKEGNLVFEQFNETNFSNSSFALTNVIASPIERVGLTQIIERGLDKKKGYFKIIKTSSVAAILALSIAIGFLLTKTYTNQNLSLGFNPVLKNENIVEEINKQQIFINESNIIKQEINELGKVFTKEEVQCFKDLGHLKEPENIEIIKEIQAKKASVDAKFKAIEEINTFKKNIKSSESPKFHIIAGCFGVESNAIKMVEKLKNDGFKNAGMVGKSKSGLLRVSYVSYQNKIVALKALAKIKLSHNINSWLVRD